MALPRGAQNRASIVLERLGHEYLGAECELIHDSAFQLLTATILSAQCTDVMVNSVTPALFARFPTAEDLAAADPEEVERLVHSTGFYRQKAKNIVAMAQDLVEHHAGEVPTELADLVKLPGVGRKTGNVVRSVVFKLPGLPVDTHVGRLARRLDLTREEDPVKVELELNRLIPPDLRGDFSLFLILHGRRVCPSRKPRCTACVLSDICPAAGTGEPRFTRK